MFGRRFLYSQKLLMQLKEILMYTINLFESSMHSNHLNNNTFLKFEFDLRVSGNIQFFEFPCNFTINK